MGKCGKRGILLLAAAVMLLLCGVGGTLAYLATQAEPVVNAFTEARVGVAVTETFDGSVKRSVCVQNTGNISVYIRAAIVVTWLDASSNTLAAVPTAEDYTMVLNLNAAGWAKGEDGFYYYASSVAAGDSTDVLITSCTQSKTYDDGRRLSVSIVASAIQAEGTGYTSAQAAFKGVSQS